MSRPLRTKNNFLERLDKNMQNAEILVGILPGDGSKFLAAHTSNTGKPRSLGQIALWLHDGTATQPPRPFLSRWFLRGRRARLKQIKAQIKHQISEPERLKNVPATIGKNAVAGIKKLIDTPGTYRKNAPYTLAKKSGTTPGRDTDTLYRYIKYRVTVNPQSAFEKWDSLRK